MNRAEGPNRFRRLWRRLTAEPVEVPQSVVPSWGRSRTAFPMGVRRANFLAASQRAGRQSPVRSAAGAAAGAAAGVAAWLAAESLAGVKIGCIALLVGALAGLGAVVLGRQRDRRVGLIAAAVGAAGIFAGSYACYQVHRHSRDVRAGVRRDYYAHQETHKQQAWARMSSQEREAAFDAAYRQQGLPRLTYAQYLRISPREVGWTVLFGGPGLYCAYRLGRGSRKNGRAEARR